MKIKYIFVHHTAVSYDINPDQWEQTNTYHKQKWDFKSSLGHYAGYNYEISKNGTVRQARADGEETAAQIGLNHELSICLDGNFDIELPTKEQTEALTKLLQDKCKEHNISYTNILPHRIAEEMHFGQRRKSCYGSKLTDDWARNLVDTETMILKLKIAIAEITLKIWNILKGRK